MDPHPPRLTGHAHLWTGGRDFEPRTVDLPELAPGMALARIDLATVCGSDIHTVTGRRPGPSPSILGHEAVGTLVATGPGGVRDLHGRELLAGDRVIWSVTVSCGDCDRCRAGRTAKCRSLLKTGHEPFDGPWALSGGYASHILLPAGIALVSVPAQISDAAAAPAACATATVMAVFEAAGDVHDRRVLVSGAGMLGIVACAVARHRGAAVVAVRDLDPDRLALARDFGATTTALASTAPVAGSYDVAVELSGALPAVQAAVTALDVGGKLVLAGSVSPGPPLPLDPERLVRSLLSITGVHNYEPRHLQQAIDFLAATHHHRPWADLVAAPRPAHELAQLMTAPRGRILRHAISYTPTRTAPVVHPTSPEGPRP